MAGLIALFVVGLWFWLAFWFAKSTTRRLKPGLLRRLATFFLTLLYIALPLADEIIGGFQFRAICEKDAVLNVNEEKIRGKTIRVEIDPSNKDLEGTAVPVYYSRRRYLDVMTKEELASATLFTAQSGWLLRLFSGGPATPPLLFQSTCGAGLKNIYNFTLIS